MRKKKSLNERLAWAGTHKQYKKNMKKKKKEKDITDNGFLMLIIAAFVIALGAYLRSIGFFG